MYFIGIDTIDYNIAIINKKRYILTIDYNIAIINKKRYILTIFLIKYKLSSIISKIF